MPRYQGELDGLCGPYSIANAMELFGVDPEATFKKACATFPRRRWPTTLWDGSSFNDMKRMVKACCVQGDIEVSFPFSRKVPASNAEYWDRLDALFDAPNTVCAIMGVSLPDPHWIVAKREGGRIRFYNSEAGATSLRKNRSSLHAGKRRKAPERQWLLDPKELILFAKPSDARR